MEPEKQQKYWNIVLLGGTSYDSVCKDLTDAGAVSGLREPQPGYLKRTFGMGDLEVTVETQSLLPGLFSFTTIKASGSSKEVAQIARENGFSKSR